MARWRDRYAMLPQPPPDPHPHSVPPSVAPSQRSLALLTDIELEFVQNRHKLRTPLRWRAREAVYAAAHRFVGNVVSFRGLRVGTFLALVIVWAVAIYLFELLIADGLRCAFVDALFHSVSAFSTTGLLTMDFSRATLATQIVTMVAFILGALWFRTIIPVIGECCH